MTAQPDAPQPPPTLASADELGACQVALRAAQHSILALGQALRSTRAALEASVARESAAERAAHHDVLTGLPNRRAFDQRANRALSQHAESDRLLFVVFIDLDGFKAVNDAFGHAAGDALLRGVGTRLSGALRRDDFVCRLGGDEFVCLLPNLKREVQGLALARKLMAAIAAPCRVGTRTLQVQASAGLALYPRDAQTVEGLLARADEALLQAKAERDAELAAPAPDRRRAGAQSAL